MLNKISLSKISAIAQLMRLHALAGYVLCYLPSMFGLMLAYEQKSDLIYIPIFCLAGLIARAAGCIINDICDRDFDHQVARTKNRPLTSGVISLRQAYLILFILLAISLAVLLTLTKVAIIIGIICGVFSAIYPLMKRFTYFPQVFLGVTFNLGALIGYAAIKDNLSINILLLYAGCCFWTIAYDTIYAFMDIKDDELIGVKSMAIFLKRKKLPVKLVISLLYSGFIFLFIIACRQFIGIYLISAIIIAVFLIIWSIITLNIELTNNCLKRFKINNYLGFILFLGLLLEKVS